VKEAYDLHGFGPVRKAKGSEERGSGAGQESKDSDDGGRDIARGRREGPQAEKPGR